MIKSSFSGSLACALSACILSVACGAHPDDVGTEAEALSSKCAPAMPDPTLNAPAGNKLAFTLDAVGVQIYTCQASGWVFQAPEATLYNSGGQLAGTHYVGPTWEANDGSKVVGAKVAGFTVDPSSVPWLLLRAVSHAGDDGRMSRVSFIQRFDTVGGVAPSSGCDAAHVGDVARVDYTTSYAFYNPSNGDSDPSSCD
jgi:hypothetical protein